MASKNSESLQLIGRFQTLVGFRGLIDTWPSLRFSLVIRTICFYKIKFKRRVEKKKMRKVMNLNNSDLRRKFTGFKEFYSLLIVGN